MSLDSDYGNAMGCDEAQYRDLPFDWLNDHDTASNQGDAGIDNFLDFPLTQYSAVGTEATATCDTSDFNITSDSANDSYDCMYVETVDGAAVQYRADRSDGSTDAKDQLSSTS